MTDNEALMTGMVLGSLIGGSVDLQPMPEKFKGNYTNRVVITSPLSGDRFYVTIEEAPARPY